MATRSWWPAWIKRQPHRSLEPFGREFLLAGRTGQPRPGDGNGRHRCGDGFGRHRAGSRWTNRADHAPGLSRCTATGTERPWRSDTGSNINLLMVRSDQAFPTRRHPSQWDPLRDAEAENRARFQRVGVGQVEGGIQRPRQWQEAKKEQDRERERERWRALQSLPPPTIRSSPSRKPTQTVSTQVANPQQCMA